MAQSSSYKQYSRATRVLTEESGFAGGMLWTGNNIDATHLKSVVNFDYDETTSYLKTRDPFKSNDASLKNWSAEQSNLSLLDKTLIGAYNICAINRTGEGIALNETLMDAGWLYLFAPNTSGIVHGITNLEDNLTAIYIDASDEKHMCGVDVLNCSLYNSRRNQLFTLYDNKLYGYGNYYDVDGNKIPDAFIQTYQLVCKDSMFVFEQLDYESYIKPRIDSVTMLEANVTGFNAARGKNTFTYTAEPISISDNPKILGLDLLDESGNVIVSPRINQTCTINVVTSYPIAPEGETEPRACTVHLLQLKEGVSSESTTAGDVWRLVGESVSTNGVHSFEFTFQKKETTFAIAYYGTEPVTDENGVSFEAAKDLLAPYVITANNIRDNVKLKNYDLSVANNHCLWNNRMCVWGTEDSNNCLFLSEVDNFYYYPIPHNVAVFDTNVISCIPYKDSLLVFTADKIYRMAETNDGAFTQTVVQNDMPMAKADAAYLTAIKNMVLFKSGNYYYMVVPKSQSLTDELSIAPVYKNIAGFLNNLDKSTLEVLQLLYPEKQFNSCKVMYAAPTAIYSEQDTVHLLYDVQTSTTYKTEQRVENDEGFENVTKVDTTLNAFKLFLNYNTNLRAWTLYIEETTEASLEPAALTASRIMSFIRIYNDNTLDIVQQQYSESLADGFRVLIDTGYRTLSSTIQKRFREVQLKLFSATENITAFGTSFLVDGVWRRSYTKLEEFSNPDGAVTLVPAFDANTFITELSMPINEEGTVTKNPGSDAIELTDWKLDFSHFKREAPVTIRVPVSGKGYNPRFIFMAPNAISLTVNEINWVYRLMHGR